MLKQFYDKVAAGAHGVEFGEVDLTILTADKNYDNFVNGPNRFFMAKSLPYIEGYLNIANSTKIERILEIGIYRGGSVVFFDNVFDLKQLTAIELSQDRLPDLDDYVQRHGRADKISLHYGVNQADGETLKKILDEDFPKSIDMVIDDASHMYGPSRASFEAIFPRMKPGGVYVIEDWSWSHSQPSDGGDNEDVTRLLHEIIDMHAKAGGLVSRLDLRPGFFSVTRGMSPMPAGEFRLADYALKRRVKSDPTPEPVVVAATSAAEVAAPVSPPTTATTPFSAFRRQLAAIIAGQ